MVDQADVIIVDPKSVLQTPIMSQTTDGKTTGKVFLKATLFDEQAAPFMELYTGSRSDWQPAVAGTVQK
ncbi:unnamed protein product [Clonostachys rosea]|uniref:Uncharacterized protein n=1 Tax=Bionectria ochroleuca TaxID=29856 RepID=A0ABY6U8V6_BIOOC|nr:unnamed protein product [Clonostachys rosea]